MVCSEFAANGCDLDQSLIYIEKNECFPLAILPLPPAQEPDAADGGADLQHEGDVRQRRRRRRSDEQRRRRVQLSHHPGDGAAECPGRGVRTWGICSS